jgi:hypothetical protein
MALYPEVNPTSAEGRRKPKIVYKPPSPPRTKPKPNPRMSWMDLPDPELDSLKNLKTSDTCDNGANSESIRKHAKMMQNLHNLRRMLASADVGGGGGGVIPEESPADGAEAPAESRPTSRPTSRPPTSPKTGKEDLSDALMISVLKDCQDNEAGLRSQIKSIQGTVDFCVACGGDRHATTVISRRILKVMRRKADLLHAVETLIKKLEASKQTRDELCAKLVAAPIDFPPELVNVPQFIKDHIHKPGEPVDAPRNFFDLFASSFKLPSKHIILAKCRDLADELGDWWAKTTNAEARKGIDREVIERLMALSISVGAEEDHPYLLRAIDVWRERIAEKVLRDAKKIQENDKMAADRDMACGRVRKVGLATADGDKVEASVVEAKEKGVKANDERLIAAIAIAKELRELDGTRRRMVNREERITKSEKGTEHQSPHG